MGTLFSQPPRNSYAIAHDVLDGWLFDVANLAKKHNVSVGDVIAAKQALEAERRNTLYQVNGDIFDEQIGGIGMLIQEMTSAIEHLKDSETY